jgi:hypothetical protein
MTFTLTFAWWWFPAAFTLLGLIWAFSIDDGGGIFGGLGNLLALVPVLGLSCVVWFVAGVLK